MSRCLKCKTKNNVGFLIIIDDLKIIKYPFSGFYPLCNKCQLEIIKPLEVLVNQIKAVQDYEERKKQFEETRSWCRRCFQPIDKTRWILIFIDFNNYIKNTSYVHSKCGKEIQNNIHAITPDKNQYELFRSTV